MNDNDVVAATKLQIKKESKKTPQKRVAQHARKKCSRDGGRCVEKGGLKLDERKQKAVAGCSLSVDTSKVCSCRHVSHQYITINMALDCIQASFSTLTLLVG